MRRAAVLSIAFMGALGLSGVAGAAPAPTQHYTVVAKDPQSGSRIEIPNGDKFQLQLTACESCGYRWKITKKPNAQVIVFDKQLKSVSQCTGSCVGGNATERFQFSSKSIGSTTVKLGYFGPGKTKPSKVKSLNLAVVA
jgi:predicted secreted protein